MASEHAPRPLGHEARLAFETYLSFSEGKPADLETAFANLSEADLEAIDLHMRRLRKAVFAHVTFSTTHDETMDLTATFSGFSDADVQYMFNKADEILAKERRFFMYGRRKK